MLPARRVKVLPHPRHQLDLSWMEHVAFAQKKPVTEIKERFGSGLDSDGGPVMFECPEETLERGVETEWGGSYSPAN